MDSNWRNITAGILLLLIGTPAMGVVAQQPVKRDQGWKAPGGGTPSDDLSDIKFDIESNEQVRDFRRRCSAVEHEAVRLLRLCADGKSVDERRAENAGWMAAGMRIHDPQAIEGLCTRLAVADGESLGPDPLEGLLTPRQLIPIGPRAIPGMFQFVRQRRSRMEMLILAHVLSRIDRSVIGLRCEAARDAVPADAEHADYRAAVEKLGLAVNSPSLVKDERNWPSRMDHPGRFKSSFFSEFPDDPPRSAIEPEAAPSDDSNHQADTRDREAAAILSDPGKSHEFLRFRKKVEREAIGMLGRRANGEAVKERVVCDAARLLGAIRSEDFTALKVLSQNLDLYEAIAGEPAQPLDGFVAAQAVVQIGGLRAFAGVLWSLKRPLNRKDLLIRAHILSQFDEPKIMNWRLEHPVSTANTDTDPATCRANFEEVRKLVSSPDLVKDRSNWPSLISQ